MSELYAKCPFCDSTSKTTDNRKGWISGCRHATVRLENGTFWFENTKKEKVEGVPLEELKTKTPYLATLRKDMTRNEFYEEIVRAENHGNYPALDFKLDFNNCQYRTSNGKACLAGTFIPDKEYCGEGSLWKYENYLKDNSPEWLTIDLFAKLQAIHDKFAKYDWNGILFLSMVKLTLDI